MASFIAISSKAKAYLTAGEAAEYMRISGKTLERWRIDGSGPQFFKAGLGLRSRVIYARVSTTDQNLRMQLDALNAVNSDSIFKDHGVSGAKSSRPGLDEMLEHIQPGDTVVVFKLDRLGRSVLHLADLLVKFRNEDIHFCSLAEGVNTTTLGGKLVYHLFSAFAEFQRDIIVENTREGMRAAKKTWQPHW